MSHSTSHEPLSDDEVLYATGEVYDSLVSLATRISRTRPNSEVIRCVAFIAGYAWNLHPGYYSDGRLERILLRIGHAIPSMSAGELARVRSADPTSAIRHVLHVASTLYEVGGHTRLISKWIEFDSESRHSVALTAQKSTDVPQWFMEKCDKLNISIRSFDGTPIDKAAALRQYSRQGVDIVVLHHHPDDVVPTIAFAEEAGPPVAVMNHADHAFWVGVSVADVVVDFRSAGESISSRLRYARSGFILPLPIAEDLTLTRCSARSLLGFDDSELIMLSMGSAGKYRPIAGLDFFSTAGLILDRVPNAKLLLIGVSEADIQRELGDRKIHSRIIPLGVISDPFAYQRAADVYLEGFPVGSQTALLESAIMGCPTVRAFLGEESVLASGDPALVVAGLSPESESAYVDVAVRLCLDERYRATTGRLLREWIVKEHGRAAWCTELNGFYNAMCLHKHQSTCIPEPILSVGVDNVVLNRMNVNNRGYAAIPLYLQNSLHLFTGAGFVRLLAASLSWRRFCWGEWYIREWAQAAIGKCPTWFFPATMSRLMQVVRQRCPVVLKRVFFFRRKRSAKYSQAPGH